RDVHEAGIAGAVPLATGVVGMPDQVDTDGELKLLGRGPDRIEVGMAEAASADRRRADEYRAAAQARDPRHFTRGAGRVAHRNVPGRKQAVTMAGHQLEGPRVVRAAERIGEPRVLDRAFP